MGRKEEVEGEQSGRGGGGRIGERSYIETKFVYSDTWIKSF